MINRKELDQIASIPLMGATWAEAVENWLCVTDALRLVDTREVLYADTAALVRAHDAQPPASVSLPPVAAPQHERQLRAA